VKLTLIERPSALTAACALVGVPARLLASDAHVEYVGLATAWAMPDAGAPAPVRVALAPAAYAANRISVSKEALGFTVNGTTKQRINGVSGVPPRGRPV